jgi:hypothetical protein
LRYIYGDRLGGPDRAKAYFYPASTLLDLWDFGGTAWQGIQGEVAPGDIINLPLLLQAPLEKGTYSSYWDLVDGSGNRAAYMWTIIKVRQEAPVREVDWSGEWSQVNTWFGQADSDVGPLYLQQSDDEVRGYFYPQGGRASGDMVFLRGTLAEDPFHVGGSFNLVWGVFLPFRWTMNANQDQFEGLISAQGDAVGDVWCGGRDGQPVPDCAAHEE